MLRQPIPLCSSLLSAFLSTSAQPAWGQQTLQEADPELSAIIAKEKERQVKGIELIASENFTSRAVMEAMGSCLTNKYSEGLPGARYYGGNEHIDELERLCQRRALEAFHLDPSEWGVNVQALSGSPANFAVYAGLLKPHQRIMGLDLASGGHLTHGYRAKKTPISFTSMFWESMPYALDQQGYIDYNSLEHLAQRFRPDLVVAGASAYPRLIDYERMQHIARSHNAYLMADIAHISGLIAGGVIPSPFPFCDVVTTTTHKSLRGPRAALIFYRKGKTVYNGKTIDFTKMEKQINSAVFPGLQGGPHNHAIAAVATSLKDAQSPDFSEYQRRVIDNAKEMAQALQQRGYRLSSNGTDTHLILVDLKSKGIDGLRAEKVLDLAHITTNKNSVPGDISPFRPGGLRLGTPAMTTRGVDAEGFRRVAQFLDRGIEISKEFAKKSPSSALRDYAIDRNHLGLKELAREVSEYCTALPMPGN